MPVYGLGTYADGRPFYVMRFVSGESLQKASLGFHEKDMASRWDDGERVVTFRGLLGRFIDAANAVAYAHSRNVLHRDLKPSNIMLGPRRNPRGRLGPGQGARGGRWRIQGPQLHSPLRLISGRRSD